MKLTVKRYSSKVWYSCKMVETGKAKKGKQTRISKFRTQRSAKLPPPVELKIHREDETSLSKIASDGALVNSQHEKKKEKNIPIVQEKNNQQNRSQKSRK